ncbi:MAG: hypothetical protein HW412_254 [Bacteroidetes bacterium]|nr:hypothetical protein [Bacteroidota bacterium]
MTSTILTIDVAHPPRHPDSVEEELLHAWSQVRNSPDLRVLKIIHGYGSSGKGGSTKEAVRNWTFRNRHKFKTVVDGEDYDLYDATTAVMRTEVGPYNDSDLGAANAGITIVWVK